MVSTFPETEDHWYPTVDIHNGKIYTAWESQLSHSIWANIIDFYDPPVNIEDKPLDLPMNVKLYPNYPNPFNALTHIRYEVPRSSHIQLKIYDIIGRQITILVDKKLEPGNYEVIWNEKDSHGNPVSSGMYFYRLDVISVESDKEFHQTNKMVLLR